MTCLRFQRCTSVDLILEVPIQASSSDSHQLCMRLCEHNGDNEEPKELKNFNCNMNLSKPIKLISRIFEKISTESSQ